MDKTPRSTCSEIANESIASKNSYNYNETQNRGQPNLKPKQRLTEAVPIKFKPREIPQQCVQITKPSLIKQRKGELWSNNSLDVPGKRIMQYSVTKYFEKHSY